MTQNKITSEQGIINFYHAFTNSDFELMATMLHEDCTLEFPGTSFPNVVKGRDNIIALLTGVQQAMGGTLAFHTKWAMFKDDMVAAHWYTTGNPAHGGAYMNRGVAWYKLKDGLVHEFLDFFDTQIITAFWPNGEPTEDFSDAESTVNNLYNYAPQNVQQFFIDSVK